MQPSLNNPARVLVSCSLASPFASDYLNNVLRCFAANTFKMLRSCGGEVDFIEASAPDRSAIQAIDTADALMMLGGADIDPASYGRTPQSDTIYGINTSADHFELDLLRLAMAAGIPILGICRGMQLINTLRGGISFRKSAGIPCIIVAQTIP